jgi:hypothetical protein
MYEDLMEGIKNEMWFSEEDRKYLMKEKKKIDEAR